VSDRDDPRLGGMALANGLLVHGPTHWAAAVRAPDGTITVASGPKPRFVRGALGNAPVIRGVLRMAEALAVVPAARRGTPGARLAMENPRVVLTMVGSAAVTALARRRMRSVVGQEIMGSVSGLMPALVALRASDAAMWHGVEHKSIAAYEAGGADEVAHAARHAKEHPRCGSNLVLPLMATSVLGNTALRSLVRHPSAGLRLGVTAVGVGAAVELFSFATRRPAHPVARVVHAVGHAMQAHLATIEPTSTDLAVGRAAMEEILRCEGTSPNPS
jgi:uncharacterized protein YqhQ